MSNIEKQPKKKGGKKKMSGWIIALIVVAGLFAVGAVFCAPWSPVYKAINADKAPAQQTDQIGK